ncbi:MAG: putative glyoxalase/bleomycin resistance protein/dioxygenase [Acidimicrobiaceae bacterium]|nr:putative glyoxalase/bleomycin resistance protein/dioxygenase [Acidimicrobiaceae bacterium]
MSLAVTIYGVCAVTFMLLAYALESRGARFVLAFALGCALSSSYGFLAGTWPFGVVEGIWTVVALRRYVTARAPGIDGDRLTAGPPGVGGRVASIDHVQLAMPPGREADARAFYEGLLGIAWVPKPEHLARRGGCWFEDGSLRVHLGVEEEFRPARKAHPALMVQQLGPLVGRLASAGVSVVSDEPLEGYERVYVEDPFGNRIELLEPSH